MKKSMKPSQVFDKKNGVVNVIIDTPKGSQVKYAFSLIRIGFILNV